jgi:hypothetical protein
MEMLQQIADRQGVSLDEVVGRTARLGLDD